MVCEGREAAGRAVGGGAGTQPLVEHLAIDHGDEAVVDGHVDLLVRGRDHARAGDPGADDAVGNGEVAHEAGRDRAAAGLDPARPVEEEHVAPAAGEVRRRGRSRGPAAHHDDVPGVLRIHGRAGECLLRGRGGCVLRAVVRRVVRGCLSYRRSRGRPPLHDRLAERARRLRPRSRAWRRGRARGRGSAGRSSPARRGPPRRGRAPLRRERLRNRRRRCCRRPGGRGRPRRLPDESAEAEGDALRRTPEAHARAPRDWRRPGSRGASWSRWRRPRRRRCRNRARRHWRAAARPRRRGRRRRGRRAPPPRSGSRRSPTDAAATARCPGSRRREAPVRIMPARTPAFWVPDSCVVSPGVISKTRPANGSRIRSCAE